jgi:hypothetical protein
MMMRELQQAAGAAKAGTQGATAPVVARSAPLPPATTEQLKAQIAQDAANLRDNAIQLRNLERIRAGQPGTTQPGDISWLDVPPRAQHLAEEFLAAIVVVVLVGPILRAVIRRFERKAEMRPAPLPPNFEPTLRQLQDTMDAMSLEIERISEGQRFMTKVIGEREKAAASLPLQKS